MTDRGSLLGAPEVRRIVVAHTMSSMGSAIGSIALAFSAYRETESIVLTVLVLAGNTVPFVLVAPISGRLLTRHDVRFAIAGSHLAKAALLAAVAFVAARGDLSYGILLAASFGYGALSALAAPGWPRMFEAIAPAGRLADVTALFEAGVAAAAIVGALAGGVIVATIGTSWAFGLDAISYVPVAIIVLTAPRLAPLHRPRGGVIRGGMRAVARSEALRRAFLLAAVLNLAAFPVLSTLPAMAHDIEPSGHVLGLLTGGFYAGAALVAIVVVRLRRRFRYSQILMWGYLGAGGLLLVHVALTDWRDPGYDALGTALATLLPIGLTVSVNAVLLQTLVQLVSDDANKGGVLILYATLASLVTPLGGVMIGAAADTWSLWWGLAGSGVVLVSIAIALRRRLGVFDTIEAIDAPGVPRRARSSANDHWSLHLRHVLSADLAAHHYSPRQFE